MQISSIPQSQVIANQGQHVQSQNTQPVIQGPIVASPKLNWKANLTFTKCREKRHLAREHSHTVNSVITQNQLILLVYIQRTSCAHPTLFPATNSTLPQTITVKTTITVKMWQTLLEELN